MHVYDDRFPAEPTATLRPANASSADYRSVQKRLGTVRTVVIQPSTYGMDNRCTMAARAELGDDARAVVVLGADAGDAEIERLDRMGARGIRFNLALGCAPGIAGLQSLAPRMAAHGWHADVNVRSHQMIEFESLFADLPCAIVFDHLGHVPQPAGTAHPAFTALLRLLETGRTWVKISGPYIDSRCAGPDYPDVAVVVRALMSAAPERLVWGSDWPHPSVTAKPDTGRLIDLLREWSDDGAILRRILVDNPAELYGFSCNDRAREAPAS
jgi:predicted TIM-barrel fold metal-dependent hydrolase